MTTPCPPANKYLYEGKCVSSCPSGTYGYTTNTSSSWIKDRLLGSIRNPDSEPSASAMVDVDFINTGSISTTNTGNSFVDLAYSVPFLASDADTYITSLVSKQFVSGFQPTFFQIPYIYSCADNLVNGKYTTTSSDDGNTIITTYKIPYTGEFKEEIATFVTYFDKTTNILFNEIPREFSYNSVDQASIAFSQLADKSFQGIINIPASFVSNVDNSNKGLNFTISPNDAISVNTPSNSTIIVKADLQKSNKSYNYQGKNTSGKDVNIICPVPTTPINGIANNLKNGYNGYVLTEIKGTNFGSKLPTQTSCGNSLYNAITKPQVKTISNGGTLIGGPCIWSYYSCPNSK